MTAAAHLEPTPVASAEDHADAYLAALNPQQRAAVEFGVGGEGPPRPLLVIAGAGSGKTDTLAHRVAHLVRHGADPQRMLLLTFSRGRPTEMDAPRRPHPGPGPRHAATTDARPRSRGRARSTASARACSACYAERIGLHASFTIHDRGDAEDLLAVVRHDLGLSATRNRFPTKATCLADLLARRQQRGAAPRGAEGRVSLVRAVGRRAERRSSGPTSPRSRRRTSSTTTTCSCTGRR